MAVKAELTAEKACQLGGLRCEGVEDFVILNFAGVEDQLAVGFQGGEHGAVVFGDFIGRAAVCEADADGAGGFALMDGQAELGVVFPDFKGKRAVYVFDF